MQFPSLPSLAKTVSFWLVLFASFLTRSRAAETFSQRSPADVQVLNDIATRYQLPALAVAASPNFINEVVGVRKAGTDVAATLNDVWELGSDTKAMVATVIARLIEQGRLSWQKTLGDLLPEIDMLPAYNNVSIELMTSHRSSITDSAITDNTFLLGLYNVTAVEGRRTVAARTLSAPPTSQQGEYVYANANYMILGLVIDSITNQTAEDVMTDLLFTPLNMPSASFGINPQSSIMSIDNPWPHQPSPSNGSAIPYGEGVPISERDLPPAYNTAGTAHMTLLDWSKFLDQHLNAAVQATGIPTLNLSASAVAKLHTPFPDTNESSEGYGYTYGAWIRVNYTTPSDGSAYTLAHCGSNRVNDACAIVDLKKRQSFFVVTNVGGTAADTAMQECLVGLRNGTILSSNATAFAASPSRVDWSAMGRKSTAVLILGTLTSFIWLVLLNEL